ncbi:hypothetical protein E2C01_021631 [Portunus trituberculatus]|uniref:Uncharacterized protein n=1 Tax=Portunus trituberculatus TaxID=210409 RepID=A0A5B7E5G1_PORTR|nr:hypothetical protein [Portunus trituberculatus]
MKQIRIPDIDTQAIHQYGDHQGQSGFLLPLNVLSPHLHLHLQPLRSRTGHFWNSDHTSAPPYLWTTKRNAEVQSAEKCSKVQK